MNMRRFNRIIDIDTRNIIVHYDDVDHISLTYYAHESKDTWTFDDSVDGTYTITQKEKVVWMNFFNYKFTPQEIVTIHIYLPETIALDLNLKTSVGDVRIENDSVITANDVKLYSNTGSIYLEMMDCKELDLKTDTGGIHIDKVNASGDVTLDSDTGSINAKQLTGKAMLMKADTGNVSLTDISGDSLNVDVDTGKMSSINATFSGAIIIDSSTGDVILNNTLGASFDIESNTGDVKLTFASLDNYRYDLKTDTGNIKISGLSQGNRHSTSIGDVLIKVNVDTGNIRINS